MPIREVQGKIAIGLNLDGNTDGRATSKTPNICTHQDFVSPEGQPGIDNQFYRAVGCAQTWRKGGYNVAFYNGQFQGTRVNRILVEVSDVDDEMNDDHVEVTVQKGIDPFSLMQTTNLCRGGVSVLIRGFQGM